MADDVGSSASGIIGDTIEEEPVLVEPEKYLNCMDIYLYQYVDMVHT